MHHEGIFSAISLHTLKVHGASMTATRLLFVRAFALALSISPGPVNLAALNGRVRSGVLASQRHVFGVTAAFCLLLLAFGFGLHRLVNGVPVLMTVLRLAGDAYLLRS